jgi:peptidoglycan/xylan/chitin deacetylase (PgdA/CDA1 family)
MGAASRRRSALKGSGKAVVLNLHRVSPDPSPYWPPMEPHVFESLLAYLDKNFEVRSLSEMNEKQGAHPIAVLSFDDGYFDFIEYALPLLKKYKMRANMNVIPKCAETGEPIWNVRLYDFLAHAPFSLTRTIELSGLELRLNDESSSSKLRFGMAMSKFLKNRPRDEREKIFQPIEDLMRSCDFPKTRMMSTQEIASIAGDSELGVHSYSHESMAHESQDFFENDFAECSRYFEQNFRSPLRIYAFPNGSYRPEQVDFLRRSNIEKILLVDEKAADPKSDVIPRITMYGDSPAEVRMRASGFGVNKGM